MFSIGTLAKEEPVLKKIGNFSQSHWLNKLANFRNHRCVHCRTSGGSFFMCTMHMNIYTWPL